MKYRFVLFNILIAVALAWISPSWALDACTGVGAEVFNLDNGVAIKGFDPVSYFTESAPRKGNSQITTTVCGVTYHFATQLHRELFLQNPGAYEPAFGGFNPYSMAFEAFTDIVPQFFDISTGRLLLFVNETTKRRYLENPALQDQAKDYFSEILISGF